MHYIVCGTQRSVKWYIVKLGVTQPLFTCCKSIKETPEQCLKSGNSLCTKWDLIARFGEHSEKENQHERVSGKKLSSRPQTSVCWQVEVWLEVLEVAENMKQNKKNTSQPWYIHSCVKSTRKNNSTLPVTLHVFLFFQ